VQRVRKRLTYANVISTLALFLVLGGATAFAAGHLGKNTVGTKQLKNNAVTGAKIKKEAITGAKIKKGSLTGTQINSATLGTVPTATNATNATNAANANHANSADSIPPAEATHLVGAAGQPGFQGGSGNVPVLGPFHLTPVGFYKDHEGIVHLQGLAKVGSGGTVSGVIFSLPPGYRPASGALTEVLALCQGETGECETDEAGDEEGYSPVVVVGSNVGESGVTLDGDVFTSDGTIVSLEGITFRAES
jgi:hypothetical protein